MRELRVWKCSAYSARAKHNQFSVWCTVVAIDLAVCRVERIKLSKEVSSRDAEKLELLAALKVSKVFDRSNYRAMFPSHLVLHDRLWLWPLPSELLGTR